jgi:hypothetical protein
VAVEDDLEGSGFPVADPLHQILVGELAQIGQSVASSEHRS